VPRCCLVCWIVIANSIEKRFLAIKQHKKLLTAKSIARLQQENRELQLPRSSTMASSQLPTATDYGLQSNPGRRGGSTASTPASKFVSELTQLMGNIDPEYKESLSLILDKHWEEVEEIRRRHQWTR
jgi:hypothetical protein